MVQFKQTTHLAGLDSSLMSGPRLWKDAPCSVCVAQSAVSIVASLGLLDPRQFGLLSDVKGAGEAKYSRMELIVACIGEC